MADFVEQTTLILAGTDYGSGGYGDGPYGGLASDYGDEYVSPATWSEASDPSTVWAEVVEDTTTWTEVTE
jgi:hypothetical protein